PISRQRAALVYGQDGAGLLLTTPLGIEPVVAPRVAAASAQACESLIGLTRDEIGERLAAAGIPERQVKMRAQQLWQWLYNRGAKDFTEMTNISKELRQTLGAKFTVG